MQDGPRDQLAAVDPGLDLELVLAPQVRVVVERRLHPEERWLHRGQRLSPRLVLVLGLVPPRTCRYDVHQVQVVDQQVVVVHLEVL